METKMKIEIWSDIVCPFCYIGKRKFDKALEQFEHRENVEVVWRSFQLFPYYEQKPGSDFYEEVGKLKGINRERSVLLHGQVTQAAKDAGLAYNFGKITLPNTFDAHRFTHFAKQNNLQNEAEERLFSAYFTEGKNINDMDVLSQLGEEIGLSMEETKEVLYSSQFTNEVKKDIETAQLLGISGIPHFRIDGEFYISGAQDVSSFLDTLRQAWNSRTIKPKNVGTQDSTGASCSVDGDCK